jgi:hypothetical protein
MSSRALIAFIAVVVIMILYSAGNALA